MTPYIYLKTQPKPIIQDVVKRAGTTFGFFRQVAGGHSTFSVLMAVAIEEATRYYATNDNDVITAVEALDIQKKLETRVREVRG